MAPSHWDESHRVRSVFDYPRGRNRMNAEQRDEMRRKHVLIDYRHGSDYPKCAHCNLGTYPCDTIRVLDALDEVLEQVVGALEVKDRSWLSEETGVLGLRSALQSAYDQLDEALGIVRSFIPKEKP